MNPIPRMDLRKKTHDTKRRIKWEKERKRKTGTCAWKVIIEQLSKQNSVSLEPF